MYWKLLIFIALLNVNFVYSQSRCDTNNTNQIFIAAEKGAEPNISGTELQVLLNHSIEKELVRPFVDAELYLNLLINCKGETIEYKFLTRVNDILENRIIEVIKANVSWKPAIENNKTVDFLKTLAFKISKPEMIEITNIQNFDHVK